MSSTIKKISFLTIKKGLFAVEICLPNLIKIYPGMKSFVKTLVTIFCTIVILNHKLYGTVLAACMIVPTACSNPNAQTGDSMDRQLIGSWGYFGDKSQPGVYIFNADGSFLHYSAVRNNY